MFMLLPVQRKTRTLKEVRGHRNAFTLPFPRLLESAGRKLQNVSTAFEAAPPVRCPPSFL